MKVAKPPTVPFRSAANRICINGRFLTQRVSGVQRFAREILQALDSLLDEGSPSISLTWVLVVPIGTKDVPVLKNILIEHVGNERGYLWDQLLRWRCNRSDILLNLANSGPVLRRRSISIIHDAAVYRTPDNFTRPYRVFHRLLGRLLAKTSLIGTVSEFSRNELASVLGLSSKSIFVVPNSCEHFASVQPDLSVLERLQLQRGSYFLTIGSPAPNKNLAAAVAAHAALNNRSTPLVVVGSLDGTVFNGHLATAPAGVVLAGRLSDQEIKALLAHATALVFPSIYEGFGIPPLEAMITGCPVIASRIQPVVEVCGDAALYFPPTDVRALELRLAEAIEQPDQLARRAAEGRRRAQTYSWSRSASLLIEAITRFDSDHHQPTR